MTRGRMLAAAVALAAGVLTYLLVARESVTPEEQIRRKAVAMADAAERKELGFILEQLSPRFQTGDGATRDDVKGLLAAQLLRGEWVRVMTTNVDVAMTSPASADFHGTYIFGRSKAKQLRDLAKESVIAAYDITGKVERESDGEWRFVSASWSPAEPASLLSP